MTNEEKAIAQRNDARRLFVHSLHEAIDWWRLHVERMEVQLQDARGRLNHLDGLLAEQLKTYGEEEDQNS